MDDGDEGFDLDNWEYGSDFGAPTDHSCGEVVVMIQGDSLDRARFRCGSICDWRIGYLIPELIRVWPAEVTWLGMLGGKILHSPDAHAGIPR